MKNIIITGWAGSGKSVIGRSVAEMTGLAFIETEERMQSVTGLAPQQVMKKYGQVRYRSEQELIFRKLAEAGGAVIAVDCLFINAESLALLRPNAFFVLLQADPLLLYRRMLRRGGKKTQPEELRRQIESFEALCLPYCDMLLPIGERSVENAAAAIVNAFRAAQL